MIKRFCAFSLAALLALSASGCSRAQASAKTLFIYMCGSSPETRLGLGGKSIDELLGADVG